MTIESKRELPPLIITEKFDNLFRDRVIDMISNKITNNPPAEGGLSEVIHQPIIEWKGQNLNFFVLKQSRKNLLEILIPWIGLMPKLKMKFRSHSSKQRHVQILFCSKGAIPAVL